MKSAFKLAILLLSISILFIGCNNQPVGLMHFEENQVQHKVIHAEIDWKPGPKNLPEGAEMVILEGNPKGKDLFSVRFRFTKDFYMPAHSHPKDERVTLLAGKAYVAFGKDTHKEDAETFNPGDYYVNKRESIHQVWADSGAIMQITGIGPWEAHFVD